ncbi:porin [Pararhizobium arenae]|uniref:porin n=1 Tax=Pararhizobium arenae TaxID=1856850 RepID=UPI00094ADD0D|nr:porin [Pararhizobium arenae]
MNIKALLAGSAAAFSFVSASHAADAIVAAEPEPMEYVRVCDAYGEGYFYIPGSETCLKIGGYVRFELGLGDDPYDGEDIGWSTFTRGSLEFDARNETEIGTVRSFIELRSESSNDTYINAAFIEAGGFRAGYADSRFDTWLDSAGNIINDDVIDYTGDRTNQVSYVYEGSNGFSALIGLEEGAGTYETGFAPVPEVSYTQDNNLGIIGGVKYEQDWGGISAVGGYDTFAESFAGKVRVDITFNDVFSAWVMGGYQSDWDNDNGPGGTRRLNYFGAWNGDWAAWGGFAMQATEKASFNAQAAYEEDGTFAGALNMEYAVADGLKFMPELNYTSFDGERGDDDAFGATIRLQRDF